MAGGIDWFRWHHGSVTDPKFQLVARKSGASLPDVLAVWVWLLEKASAADFRGCFGEVDCEALDCLFGFDDGITEEIMGAMVDRKLIADEYIVAWEKRQPKREDDNAAERKRQQREREAARAASVTCGESRNVTQSHTESREVQQCHARGEESREEKKREEKDKDTALAPAPRKRGVCVSADDMVAEGVDPIHARDWLQVRKAKDLPLTPTAWTSTKLEALKAGLTPAQAVQMAAENNWGGFKASWTEQSKSPLPSRAAEPAWIAQNREFADVLTGRAKRAAPVTAPFTEFVEVIDGNTRRLG